MAIIDEKTKMHTEMEPVDITFSDLTYTVPISRGKGKKTILKGVSGTFKSGELTAIMGPSGAGKSSLLNILTGFVKIGVSGQISIAKNGKESRKICSYILQEDNLFPLFTVQETMILAATLKISNKSMSTKEKHILVENILSSLGLSFSMKTRCSNLSGGQRKRLSIALELLDDPPVLFLDEPTTGLDSSSSADCISLLNKLSTEGRTVVCTIHQPSASLYHEFGHIYVLAEGNCVYQGPPSNTVPFLSSVELHCPQYHNPADFLIEVTNKEYGDYTKALTEAAEDPKWRTEEKAPTLLKDLSVRPVRSINYSKKIYPPSEWIKLWILMGRCHILFYRDWTVTHLKLVLHILCAILIGILYGDSGTNATKTFSNVGLLMIGVVYIWYTTMMPSVLKFPLEIATIKKETFNNWYKLRTYYLATQITSTPIHVLFSITFATILYLMTSQPLEVDRFMKYVLTFITLTIAADGFGIFLGTMANPINGTFFGAVLTCFMVAFAGFLIFFHHMPFILRLVSYLSPHRYAFHSLILSVYDKGRTDLICPSNIIYCHYKKAEMIIKTLGMSDGDYNTNILMIILTIIAVKIVAYFTLRRALRMG
ncbi:unnamed protein product [Hermetia illucens]|uniref:ABC transporter domain-containing protein n=1 Tax=Hermetia illucens TaxID=343691 RepID=A0A7R8YP06_HERIL|nr:ATP-binding cassette sub-family G member 1 [Hermetia illucens]XP_037926757.1 ATP-binding cassette sub-family G member 1 [Hermetia illucens]CAD7079005.1 unnamed protein product [Hermetia illucens]